jgi:hypothetical protein
VRLDHLLSKECKKERLSCSAFFIIHFLVRVG